MFHNCETHLRIPGKFPGHECDTVSTLLELDLVLTVLHHGHLLDQQAVGDVIEDAVSCEENNVPVLYTELVLVSRFGPVCKHLALKLCRREGELERGVEIVLLLLASVHDLSTPHHQETTVTNVRGIQHEIIVG